ncbi:MAG: YeeE/YedE thiosulfate transporter family protein [Tistlia sp.]|uniref:YeeE/YedE thiosulfate transporter family protein n=1 Tax=Tistlia sp. TaxID=3057121 RepID=UPI0034A34F87
MRRQLLLGLIFGFCFGFLLQKGGVAKFDVLIGQLLLEDFTVLKVMLTAVLVGMIGVWTLHGLGLVQLHVKPTRYAANVVGGLVFGAGFALAAYCPGTGAAALGQGNFDALAVMLGMVLGAFVFAALPGLTGRLSRRGDRGQLTWPALLHLRTAPFIAGFAVLLVLVLAGVEGFLPR